MHIDTVKTTQSLLGTPITLLESSAILSRCLEALRSKKRIFLATPNPEILVRGFRDTNYGNILSTTNFCLPDGIGVVLALRILYGITSKRIPGVSFVDTLCCMAEEQHLQVFFLGGRDGANERCAKSLTKRYPNLRVAGCFEGESSLAIAEFPSMHQASIRQADIIFVAFGAPYQEEWIAREMLFCKQGVLLMGVGGSFDIIAGDKPRAPHWIQHIGGEWLYRLWLEPWRWRRMLVLPQFVFLVLREKVLSLYRL